MTAGAMKAEAMKSVAISADDETADYIQPQKSNAFVRPKGVLMDTKKYVLRRIIDCEPVPVFFQGRGVLGFELVQVLHHSNEAQMTPARVLRRLYGRYDPLNMGEQALKALAARTNRRIACLNLEIMLLRNGCYVLAERPVKRLKRRKYKPADYDEVSRPQHYVGVSGVEAREIMIDAGLEENANLFNAVKYLLRAGKKGSEEQDLQKARQFILFELERLKRPRLFNPYVDGAAGLAREFLIRGDVAQAAFLILDGGANPDPAELEYIESWIISAIEQAEQAQEAAE